MQELALLMVTECADAQEPEFARLVRQAKAGDAAAFEAILCQFDRRVLLTAMRLLNGNLEDAKDAAQQVFLRTPASTFTRVKKSSPAKPTSIAPTTPSFWC